MPQFTVNPVAITANVQKNSAGHSVPAGLSNLTAQMTDEAGNATPLAGSTWLTTPGNVTKWGIQRSSDGGATWLEPDGGWFNSGSNIPFGTLTRGGKLPSVALSSDTLAAAAGDQLRLAILTDAGITLGAVVTTA